MLSSKAMNELETEKQLNLYLREGKKDLSTKIEKLEKSLTDKDQVGYSTGHKTHIDL